MRLTNLHIKPALKGEVGFALAKAGGVEKESRFAWYRQPLSQTFGLPAPRPGSLLGGTNQKAVPMKWGKWTRTNVSGRKGNG